MNTVEHDNITSRYKKSAELIQRAEKVLAGGVSSEFRKYAYPHPLFYSHAEGVYIYDVDGNRYLDFSLSQGPMILGHSHPEVLGEIENYSKRGQLFAGQHILELELAEYLQRLVPSAELTRFCLDGSSAVQTAFRVARAKTGKAKFLRFEGHYHGWLDNVCFGLTAPAGYADSPRLGSPAYPWTKGLPARVEEEFVIVPWNDSIVLKNVFEKYGDQLAAAITEPVMCNNGCIEPHVDFLQLLRDLCTRYNVALIFDEVITGFRMALGGAQSFYGVTPDLSVFAKAMASGYPISAVTGKRDLMEMISQSRVIHAGTMNSSNPTVAAAMSTLRCLEKSAPYEKMTRRGKRLMEGLRTAAIQHGHAVCIQGPGPMFHLAFSELDRASEFRDTLAFDKEKMKRFVQLMHQNNVRLIPRGLWYISAVHSDAHVDEAIEAADKVFKAMSKQVVYP